MGGGLKTIFFTREYGLRVFERIFGFNLEFGGGPDEGEVEEESGEEGLEGDGEGVETGPEGGGEAAGYHPNPSAEAGTVFSIDRVEEKGTKGRSKS